MQGGPSSQVNRWRGLGPRGRRLRDFLLARGGRELQLLVQLVVLVVEVVQLLHLAQPSCFFEDV